MNETYPSRVRRSSDIAGVEKSSGEAPVFVCGRLVSWNPEDRLGTVRDASGDLPCNFDGWAGEVNVGDIIQIRGVPGPVFKISQVNVLTPGRAPGLGGASSYIRWREVMADRQRFELLKLRSDFLRGVREFFYDRGFIEIDAPALVPAAGMEPHIEPFTTRMMGHESGEARFFLHTSPEFTLKKMLVAGYERIFCLGHTFRNGEYGPLHAPEFAMLEWYRAYEDYEALMVDCQDLLRYLDSRLKNRWAGLWRRDRLLQREVQVTSLSQVMAERCELDLARIGEKSQVELIAALRLNGLREGEVDWPIDDLFFVLFLNRVEAQLGRNAPQIVRDYPIWMASLAKKKDSDQRLVERFELYIDGIELANAFTELNDPVEQRQRLIAEQDQRQRLRRSEIPVDEDFLAALTTGMPPAAGIALGLDRLLMVCCDLDSLEPVLFWGPRRGGDGNSITDAQVPNGP